MTITEIKKIGKGDRYSLYVDGLFVSVIEAEILAKSKLKTGDEISESELEKLKHENGDYASFDRALSYLERGMKTEKGIRDYLLKKGYPKVCIDKAVEKLIQYGYINDEVFAENYIKTYSSSKGKKKLKYELLSKGVSDEIISNKLEECIDCEEEEEVCFRLAKKYLKNKIIDLKTKAKLGSHLASKGFSYDLISKVSKKVLSEVKDESWD